TPDDERNADPRMEICVTNADAGQETCRIPLAPNEMATRLAFQPDGRHLAATIQAVVVNDGERQLAPTTVVVIWDLRAGPQRRDMQGTCSGAVRGFVFSPDGGQLAAAGPNGVHVWDAASGRSCFDPLPVATPLMGLAYSPDGGRLAGVGRDGLVRMWDAGTGHELLVLRAFGRPGTGHYGFVASVVFSPDGRRLAANNWEGTLTIWDAG